MKDIINLKIDQKNLNKGKIQRITKDETKEVGKRGD